MATEKYVNNAQTTLNGSINNSTTTVVVTSAASFSASGNFRIIVDSEIMLVTSVSSNTFTVTRGVEGTSGASHSSGASCTHVLTAASLLKIISDLGISVGLADRKPSTPGTYDEEWEGTANTLPSGWSWGSAPSGSDSWTVNSNWPSLLTVEGTGNAQYLLTKASVTPGSGTFGVWTKGFFGPVADTANDWRIFVWNSGETDGLGIDLFAASGTTPSVRGVKVVSSSPNTAFGSGATGDSLGIIVSEFYFGLTRDGSNVWTAWYSNNGIAWSRLGSTESASFTIDHLELRLCTNSVRTFSGCDWVRTRSDNLFPKP